MRSEAEVRRALEWAAAMSNPTGLPNGYYWAKTEVGPSFPVLLSDGVWFQATWEQMPEGQSASLEIGDRIEEPE